MRKSLHAQLLALARREVGSAHAEDVVQDALVVAVECGRHDLELAENARWLSGVVRNRARMLARSARRRLRRDGAWQASHGAPDPADPLPQAAALEGLSPALKALAALVLAGHNRAEIAYLLALSDSALRQRVRALKRHMLAQGLAAPRELTGLGLDLAYGRIRDALLPALLRHGGVFATHDPDGHLFVIRRSQNAGSRQ